MPAEQLLQTDALVVELVPIPQTLQFTARPLLYLPASQDEQVVAPVC